MALNNDMQVKSTQLPDGKKKAKFSVGAGLYLIVNQSGKYWRYDYKYNGKRKEASLGVYSPGSNRHLSLKEAKAAVQDVKNLLGAGIDPNQHKKELRQANIEASKLQNLESIADASTFEVIARQWYTIHENGWSDKHAKTILRRFELHVFPAIGSIPVAQLTKSQVADVLTAIAARGTVEIAKRIAQITRQVLEYASDRGLIEAIPMGNMKTLLPQRKAKPMPAITDSKRIGMLLRAIHAYEGSFVVCQALKLLPLVAVRSGEFRAAEWSEFDMEGALWSIPAAHRKLAKVAKADPANVHLVPLSTQAVTILKDLKQFTGSGKYVFPSMRRGRPMSENTVNVAIHAMGYDDMVGHGWRAVFSTSLNEQGFNPDAIERQLAHAEQNAVRAAYNRGDYLDERKNMMQHWADYLDRLRNGVDNIS
ncbi:MAG: tyrosine-type recombinase/integrase [Mariprofundus sp.]